MNNKPKDTPELIGQLLKSDKTIKVSDVATIVATSLNTVIAVNPEIRESKVASCVVMDLTAAIITGIATIDMSRDEAVAFTYEIIKGDHQIASEPKSGGEA